MDGVRINGDSGSVDTGTRGREFMIAHTSAMKVVNTSCVKSFSSSAYKHRVKYLSSGTNYSFPGSTHVGGMWRVEFPHRSRVVQLILEGSIFDVDSVNRQIVYKVCTSIRAEYLHFTSNEDKSDDSVSGVGNFVGQAQAQGFLNFLNPSPVSDLPSPNL